MEYRFDWESAASGEPAAWLTTVLRQRGAAPRSAQLLALVETMAARLRADGVPVDAITDIGNSIDADLDMLDLLIAHQVPVVERDVAHLSFHAWIADESAGRRDLLALVDHPSFVDRTGRAAVDLLRDYRYAPGAGATLYVPLNAHQLDRMLASPGLAKALRRQLDLLAGFALRSPLAALEIVLRQVRPLCSRAGQDRFGEALSAIGRADAAEALAATLRTGLPAEFGWPAYDEAVSLLGEGDSLQLGLEWPRAVVHNAHRALVIGPDGVEADHQLRVPERDPIIATVPPECTLHDGRLFVSWYTGGVDEGHWVDRPQETLRVGEDGPDLGRGVVLSPRGQLLAEVSGPSLWSQGELRNLDKMYWATPVPEPWRASPLGCAGGVFSARVVRADGCWHLERADGKRARIASELLTLSRAVAAIVFPGDPTPRLLSATSVGSIFIWPPAGDLPAHEQYSDLALPPVQYWHAMRVRDENGSLALRRVAVEQARALLGYGAIPAGISDPKLRAAVHAEARKAASLEAELRALRGLPNLPPEREIPLAAEDRHLLDGLIGLLSRPLRIPTYRRGHLTGPGRYVTIQQIHHVDERLRGLPGRKAPPAGIDWAQVLPTLGAVGWRAAMPTTPEPEREALLCLLQAWTELPEGPYRVVEANTDRSWQECQVGVTATSSAGLAVIVEAIRSSHVRHVRMLDRSTGGEFGDITGFEIEAVHALSGWGNRDQITELISLVRRRGPAPWRGGADADEAMVLTGYHFVDSDEPPPAQALSLMGLSTEAAMASAVRLREVPIPVRARLLHESMPADARRLWDDPAVGEHLLRMRQEVS